MFADIKARWAHKRAMAREQKRFTTQLHEINATERIYAAESQRLAKYEQRQLERFKEDYAKIIAMVTEAANNDKTSIEIDIGTHTQVLQSLKRVYKVTPKYGIPPYGKKRGTLISYTVSFV